eukprot:95151-Pleurochrysis_carterae.AAC.1
MGYSILLLHSMHLSLVLRRDQDVCSKHSRAFLPSKDYQYPVASEGMASGYIGGASMPLNP